MHVQRHCNLFVNSLMVLTSQEGPARALEVKVCIGTYGMFGTHVLGQGKNNRPIHWYE
uniref:Uncharacterized protein n=1 Tax=Anopheles atroparvus TaxID=41427 RepID=A0AAG5D7I9_ANOAO